MCSQAVDFNNSTHDLFQIKINVLIIMSRYTFWVLNDWKKFKILNLQNANNETLSHKLEKMEFFIILI